MAFPRRLYISLLNDSVVLYSLASQSLSESLRPASSANREEMETYKRIEHRTKFCKISNSTPYIWCNVNSSETNLNNPGADTVVYRPCSSPETKQFILSCFYHFILYNRNDFKSNSSRDWWHNTRFQFVEVFGN